MNIHMDEITSTLQAQEEPLDDNLKRQIDNLEEMDEEQLLIWKDSLRRGTT